MSRKRGFFFWFSTFLLMLSVAAFASRAILDTEHLPPLRASLVVHAMACTLWLFLVPVQSWLAFNRHIRTHRSLGWVSVGLVVAILSSGLVVSFDFLDRTQMFRFFFPGVVNFFLFFVFYLLALLRLRDIEFHKRMMLFASLALTPPALNRLVFAFDMTQAFTQVGWPLLVLAVPAYDRYKFGRIKTGTKVGLALVVGGILTTVVGSQFHRDLSSTAYRPVQNEGVSTRAIPRMATYRAI